MTFHKSAQNARGALWMGVGARSGRAMASEGAAHAAQGMPVLLQMGGYRVSASNPGRMAHGSIHVKRGETIQLPRAMALRNSPDRDMQRRFSTPKPTRGGAR